MPSAGWTQTIHCQSRRHCRACQADPVFRKRIAGVFGPFECPLDQRKSPHPPLPKDGDGAEQQDGVVPNQRTACRLAEVLDKPFLPNRPRSRLGPKQSSQTSRHEHPP